MRSLLQNLITYYLIRMAINLKFQTTYLVRMANSSFLILHSSFNHPVRMAKSQPSTFFVILHKVSDCYLKMQIFGIFFHLPNKFY